MKSPVMTTTVLIAVLLFSVAANADCARIAYSRTTGDYGTGYESGSCSSSSSSSAVSSCGRSDCIVELTVQGECGSIARKTGDTNLITTGVASSKSSAGNKAIAACGSNCKLVTSICAN